MRGIGVTAALGSVVALSFFYWSIGETDQPKVAPASAQATSVVVEKHQETPRKPAEKSPSINPLSSKQEFTDNLAKLSQALKNENLDTEELLHRILNEGYESVEAELSPQLQVQFKDLHKSARALNIQQLHRDGFSTEFFDIHPRMQMPPTIKTRRTDLREIDLPQQVQNFVDLVSESEKVFDEDIQEILSLCRRNRDCVEKSVTSWIDANHLLSERQLQTLESEMENQR